jgi:hypothetical protein
MMLAKFSALSHRADPGSMREAKLPPTQEEARKGGLLTSQIPSEGFHVDGDPQLHKWSNAKFQPVLEALLAAESCTLGVEEKDEREEVGKRIFPAMTVEKHIPGLNDMMSGALRQCGPLKAGHHPVKEFDDHTVSIDTLPHLFRSMPHYMVSVKVLKTLNLFDNPLIYDVLPDGFFTTIKGLKRAWDEANAEQPDATADMDEYLLDAILRRGGVVENEYWSVKYPCDIVPTDGGEGDLEFWREIREMTWNGDEIAEREQGTKRGL